MTVPELGANFFTYAALCHVGAAAGLSEEAL